MEKSRKPLSVTQTADMCGVGRTTVGYWIRSGKLLAGRTGKKYEINIQDLLYFLRSNGQKIPAQLEKDNLSGPVFRTFQSCWRFHQDNPHGLNCQQCIAFKNSLEVCFSARNSASLGCLARCETCRYYQEAFYPRLQFIYQFDTPAAIVKDLCFWTGNLEMAKLCEVKEKELIGMGVEQIVHPSSLEQVICGSKKRALGEPGSQTDCMIYIKNNRSDKIKVRLSVFLLKEPKGAFLVMAERETNGISLTEKAPPG
jgi:excisionase family DNA binding protein